MICVMPFPGSAHGGYYEFLKNPQTQLNRPLMRECVARTSAQCWDTYTNAPAHNEFAIAKGWRTTHKVELRRAS